MLSQSLTPKYRKEVVVPVIGMSGVGKSTFINRLLGSENDFPVGTTMNPCTDVFKSASIIFDAATLKPYPTIDPTLKDYAFTIVDTPGFDHGKIPNDLIIENLIQYLKDSKKLLGGVIYFHDITTDRISDEARRLFERLENRYTEASSAKVVFGTTKAGRLSDDSELLNTKLSEFANHWVSMTGKGARILSFDNTRLSALKFLELIINARQEILIPVMGASGAGKSTFINYLPGQDKMDIGHQMSSCTSKIQSTTFILDTPILNNYVITMVDTPGFDDTYASDTAILRSVAQWLERSYRQKKVLAGVIYLHDISSDRFSGTARRNLKTFNDMCGDAALGKVVLGMTKWGRTSPTIAQSHQTELESVHWHSMIQGGSDVLKFGDSHKSAIQFIEVIVSKMKLDTYLAIQSELVDDKKIIPETKAGQELRYTLKEILEAQKKIITQISRGGGDQEARKRLAEATEKIKILDSQIRELKIPLTRKLRKLFRLL